MTRGASVSAAKTPTAEPVSRGALVPKGRKHRAWRRLFSLSVRTTVHQDSRKQTKQGSAVGVDSGGSQEETPTRTACRAGGLEPKCAFLGTFWAMTSPREGVSPGSSRGLDARGLRKPVHPEEQVDEQVGEQPVSFFEHRL